jgi:hypothetical protein
MSIAARLYKRILLYRIRDKIDQLLSKTQVGFRVGRSCIQQINILRRIMAANKTRSALHHFCRLQESIRLHRPQHDVRNPTTLLNTRKHCSSYIALRQSTSRVYVGGQLSDPFTVTKGVLKGVVLAPFLFFIVIDFITKRAAENHGFVTHEVKKNETGRSLRKSTRPPERRLNDPDFADDISTTRKQRTAFTKTNRCPEIPCKQSRPRKQREIDRTDPSQPTDRLTTKLNNRRGHRNCN